MVRGELVSVVNKVLKNRNFSSLEPVISQLQILQSNEATLALFVERITQKLPPQTNKSGERANERRRIFCEEVWIGSADNETIFWFIEAAIQCGENHLASFVSQEVCEVLHKLPDDNQDKSQFVNLLLPKHRRRCKLDDNECPLHQMTVIQEQRSFSLTAMALATIVVLLAVIIFSRSNGNSPVKVLQSKSLPRFDHKIRFHQQRTNDIEAVVQLIKQKQQLVKGGLMAIHGESGAGKTTLLTDIFESKQFAKECNISTIIWLNCFRWGDGARPFNDEAQNQFKAELVHLAKMEADVTVEFDDIVSISAFFLNRVLFVLDDVSNPDIVIFMRKELADGQRLPVIVVTDDINAFLQHPNGQLLAHDDAFQISTNRSAIATAILESAVSKLQIETRQQEQIIKQIADRCNGLPLMANLVALSLFYNQRYKDEDNFNRVLQLITKEDDFTKFFNWFLEQELPNDEDRLQYYDLLSLLQPEEPGVSIADLAVVWFPDEEDEEVALRKSHAFCSKVEASALLTRSLDHRGEPLFYVHQLLHKASAKKYIDEKKTRNDDRLVNILVESVRRKRWSLLEKIIDGLDPFILADLCKITTNSKTYGKTWLHFLYHNVTPKIAEEQESRLAESMRGGNIVEMRRAYRLIGKVAKRLHANGISYIDIFQIKQSEFRDSLFSEIFDDDILNRTKADVERTSIARLLAPWFYQFHEEIWLSHVSREHQNEPVLAAVLEKRCDSDFEAYLSDKIHSVSNAILMNATAFSARLGAVDCLEILMRNIDEEKLRKGILTAKNDEHRTPLWTACSMGHLNVVRFFYDKYPKLTVDTKNNKNNVRSQLYYAIGNGHVDILRFLYEKHPAAPRQMAEQSGGGWSPLMIAALSGHLETVRFTYETAPASINIPLEREGWTPLFAASYNGHLETVQFLYDKSPQTIENVSTQGQTAFLIACSRGNLDVAKFLYAKWPDAVKIPDQNWWTPLMVASHVGHLETVKFVYNKHPQAIKITNKSGETALQMASMNQHDEVVHFLQSKLGSLIP